MGVCFSFVVSQSCDVGWCMRMLAGSWSSGLRGFIFEKRSSGVANLRSVWDGIRVL